MPLTPAEKQAAYRARQQASTERDLERGLDSRAESPSVRDDHTFTVPDLMIRARAGTLVLTESQEQRIRSFWGYQESEKRTLLERDAAAARINEP